MKISTLGFSLVTCLCIWLIAPIGGLAAQVLVGRVAAPLEPVKDVGRVRQGDEITHAFELRNDGTAPLELTNVKPSCGCTVVEFDDTIAPGETGAVQAVLDTERFRGPIAKSISVFTNDPETPRIVLVIKADIRTHLEATPSYARFLTVSGEPVEKQEIVVWASDIDDLQISRVDSPFDFLQVEHRLATADERLDQGTGRQWHLELVLSPKAPVGPIADKLTVRTNHPEQRILEIPISGFVRPVIAVSPAVADFGHRQVSDPFETSLEVLNYSKRDIQVSEVTSDISSIRAELEPVDEGRRYQVRLTLEPGMPPGEFSGTLRIRTSNPSEPVLEVPLKGTIL